MTEDSKEEEEKSVPLDMEATKNVNALHAYAVGEEAMQGGRAEDALAAYREATGLDPKFVQAKIRLAWLYGEEKAEVASASAAEEAQAAAANVSEKVKLLAQFCYEMNSTGDYGGLQRRFGVFVPVLARCGWDAGAGGCAAVAGASAGGAGSGTARYRRASFR